MAHLYTGTFAIFLAATATARAQPIRPPLELGVGISGIANLDLGDFGLPPRPFVDARVTILVSNRFAVEGTMCAARHVTSYAERAVIYYTFQVKQTIGRRTTPGRQPFLTYGVLGAVERFSSSRHTATQYSMPGAAVIGAGVQRELGRHVGVRADAQLLTYLVIPLGARFTGSVSIPIGQYGRQ